MGATRFRAVIVEDHPIFRDGLRSLLSAAPDVEVVGEAADGASAIRCVSDLRPEFVVVGLSLPGMSGVEVITEIKHLFPTTRILALTVHADTQYITAALRAGVDGYVLKDADRAEVITAMRAIMGGNRYLSPGVSDVVIKGFVDKECSPEQGLSSGALTNREQEILTLIAEGYTNKAIADRLSLSIRTIEKYRARIMAKLDLHSPQALTTYAIQNGLISC
jgi:DNA-binding NarL/FixJ family response regulator